MSTSAPNASTASRKASLAAQKASTATQKASTSAPNAYTAAQKASLAAQKASTAAQKTPTATQKASTAALKASTASPKASTTAPNASTAASKASRAVPKVSTLKAFMDGKTSSSASFTQADTRNLFAITQSSTDYTKTALATTSQDSDSISLAATKKVEAAARYHATTNRNKAATSAARAQTFAISAAKAQPFALMVAKNVQADSGTTTADKAPAAITDTKAATSLSASKCPQAASQNVHAVVTSTAQALTAAAVSKTPATKSKGLSRISSRGQTPSNPIRLVPLSSLSSNEAIKRKKIIQPRTNIVMGQTAISSHPAVRPPRGSVLSPKMFITESGINLLRPAVASRHYAQPSTLQSTLLMSGGGVSVAPSALFAPEGFGVIPTPSAESAAVSSRPNGTKYSLLAANSLNSAVTPSRPAVSTSAANRAFDALLPAVDMMSRSAVEPTAAAMRNVGSTAVKNSPTISFSSPEGLSPFAARQVSSTSSQFKGI